MDGGEGMDLINSMLCDELLAAIFWRVEDRRTISLVCKRWLLVEGNARTNLGLSVAGEGSIPTFCSIIHHVAHRYSQITSLTIISEEANQNPELSEQILAAIGSNCHSLKRFKLLQSRVTVGGLEALAKGCPRISSLHLMCPNPKHLPFLINFKALTELTLTGCHAGEKTDRGDVAAGSLGLDKLCLEGLGSSSWGLGWLWKSCRRLTRLELLNCEGVGDPNVAVMRQCMESVQEVHLKRCRAISNLILNLMATSCKALKVLVFQDGGDTTGLHHVIKTCTSLEVLDLRLPLDLFNEDLAIIAQNSVSLKSLRLHSCWMATGAGLKLLGTHLRSNLEDLALIRCRAIVQDPGTLTCLGQHLKSLQSLDLSDNDLLADKELTAMLASSCQRLTHLRLRRCRKLTNKAMEYIGGNCWGLRILVILYCDGITTIGLTHLLAGCPSLETLWVENSKLSNEVKSIASKRKVLLSATEPSPSYYQA